MIVRIKTNPLHDDRASQIVSWGHWFALFNIFLVIILGSRYLFIADWPPTFLGRFYAIISSIGHFSFLTFVGYLILLFPFSFIIRSPRWYRIISILVATIAITILLIDIEVFSRFRMHLNFSIWQILTESDDNLLSSDWQRLFIFVPFIILLQTLFAIWSWRKLRSLTKRRRYSKPFVIIFILCFVFSHLIHIWADANFYRPITMQRSSLPLSYPLTARHFLERHGFIEEGNYQSRIKQEGNPFAIAIEYPLGKISTARLKSPYNILMITVDEWNLNTKTEAMPNLAEFAKQNIQFANHYSASSDAYLGEFSLFYSLDPNYYDSILASNKPSVFISTLIKQQYSLGLFSTDGFAHPLYRHGLLSNFSMLEPKIQSSAETTNLWLSWHNEQQKAENTSPWFSLVQYKANNTKDNHKMDMRDIDNAIEKIINQLQKSDEMDRTIVVITASNTAQSLNQSEQEFDRQSLQVPLIIAWPNKNSEVITMPTAHVDIIRTLMQNALNVKTAPKQYSQGMDLFDDNQRRWLVAGKENEITAIYPDKAILIDSSGYYQIYDQNGQLQKNEKLGLSTFLQLVSENRRFMVTN